MRTLVIGASENTDRYSYKAILSLMGKGHEVVALSNKKGSVIGVDFLIGQPKIEEQIDTVTLYINPQIQRAYYDYIVGLNPNRVIFNPGTENSDFMEILKQNQIEAVIACTLVMLNTGQY